MGEMWVIRSGNILNKNVWNCEIIMKMVMNVCLKECCLGIGYELLFVLGVSLVCYFN